MYEIMKSAIVAGGYKLAEIQSKVKKLYIMGDLEEAQMDELLTMSQQNVSADTERPEILRMLRDLSDRIEAIEKSLISGGDASEGNGNTEEYEAWAVWDGISDKYQQGTVVSHNGQLWESVYAGQNVWEPGISGTENLWVKYTPETEGV